MKKRLYCVTNWATPKLNSFHVGGGVPAAVGLRRRPPILKAFIVSLLQEAVTHATCSLRRRAQSLISRTFASIIFAWGAGSPLAFINTLRFLDLVAGVLLHLFCRFFPFKLTVFCFFVIAGAVVRLASLVEILAR